MASVNGGGSAQGLFDIILNGGVQSEQNSGPVSGDGASATAPASALFEQVLAAGGKTTGAGSDTATSEAGSAQALFEALLTAPAESNDGEAASYNAELFETILGVGQDDTAGEQSAGDQVVAEGPVTDAPVADNPVSDAANTPEQTAETSQTLGPAQLALQPWVLSSRVL